MLIPIPIENINTNNLKHLHSKEHFCSNMLHNRYKTISRLVNSLIFKAVISYK